MDPIRRMKLGTNLIEKGYIYWQFVHMSTVANTRAAYIYTYVGRNHSIASIMNHNDYLDLVGHDEVEFVRQNLTPEFESLLPWVLEVRQARHEKYAPDLPRVTQKH